ncbi:uncharacterized protein LOC105420089 [Amborella trichopoda]|uniref:uncharacterized protein LOC105420089 n=1 Tax=Amborella trichopoda TaxID=13333 RepID=UPI0005D390E0|nr:uncharacterized protein LOC105420089 [Amborella trichopoda]|eukprot:XP_011620641.1 uncharacterized protein LOC105420089 [Amborella trichopoda]
MGMMKGIFYQNALLPAKDALEAEKKAKQGRDDKSKRQEEEIFDPIGAEVEQVDDWMEPIINFLKHGRLPEDCIERNNIRRLATKYTFLNGDVLFRRSFDAILLRGIDTKGAKQVLEEVHAGICGFHQSDLKLYERIYRLGYYWPSMVTDSLSYDQEVLSVADTFKLHS